MPTNGLSLVGFMDQAVALTHLKSACVPGSKTDAQLIADWQTAQTNLGAPISNAGQPNLHNMPVSAQAHCQQIAAMQPAIAQALAQGAEFKMVEVDPLLAFQFHVDIDRSAHHCAGLSNPPSLAELLTLCLPLNPPAENYTWNLHGQSLIVKARSLNIRLMAQGLNIMNGVIGLQVIVAFPFVYVTRYNGRCYLTNGFHRTYGARLAGAGEVPCLFREVPDAQSVGIRDDGGTFKLGLLESGNPPTVGHFTQGRAQAVALRLHTRVIHAGWAEHVVFEE